MRVSYFGTSDSAFVRRRFFQVGVLTRGGKNVFGRNFNLSSRQYQFA